MARVALVVSDRDKARWERVVDERDELDSVSDLVRTSVSKHIARMDEDGDGWTEEQIDAIIEYLDDIDKTTTTTQTILENHRDEAPNKIDIEEAITYQRASIEEVVKSAVREELSEKEE
jgi:Arc/MetJ-type ribon-helix-helix transcriptional regulator